jgi:hypothetical protein
MRVGVKTVVEDPKLCESRHQLNQIDPTPVVALPDLLFWDVVPPSSHPGSDARHVQLGTTQSHEPHAHIDSSRQRFVQKSTDGVPAQRRFERDVQAFGDRSFQKAFALVPGSAVRFCRRDIRTGGQNSGGRFVRIEVVCAGLPKHRACYAALPGTVGSSYHVDAWTTPRTSHASAPQRPQPCPNAFQTRRTPPSFRDAPWMFASAPEAHRIRR